MLNEAPIAQIQGATRSWFVGLVAYYILALYLMPSTAQVERFSLTYYAFVVPGWLYVAGNWRFLLSGYTPASKLLALFAVLTVVVGIFRADLPLAYNAAYLAAVAVVILNSKAYLTVAELNWLFLGTIVGSIVVHSLGLTAYGFLPGQAESLSCHASMNWRVSLFRVTAESAMFSLIVLMANIALGDGLRGWVRGLVIFVSAYFLIFSGVRTIIVAAMIVTPVIAMIVLRRESATARRWAAIGTLVGAASILSVPHWLGKDAGFWKNYVLRNETCSYLARYFGPSGVPPTSIAAEAAGRMPPDWYAWTLNRHCGAVYQVSLFVNAPFGTPDVHPTSDEQLTALGCPADQLQYYCANCVFVTYWLARAGIAAVPLVLSFFVLTMSAVRRRNFALAWGMAAFAIVSFGWGVMYVPYNFIFLIMMALPAMAGVRDNRSRRIE